MHFSLTTLCVLAVAMLAGATHGELEAADSSRPIHACDSLQNLDSDPVQILSQAPLVAKVRRDGPEVRPSHRIIHLADWHVVDRDDYASDLRSLSHEPISKEEIDRRFAVLLDEVERVQTEQLAILRWLIKYHGLDYVYVEGLSKQDQPIIDSKFRVLQNVGQQLAKLKQKSLELQSKDEPSAKELEIANVIRQLEHQYRCDLLQVGAAGRLVVSGELAGVLPLEDEDAYQVADPIGETGNVAFDQEKIEARQDGQVRRLLESGPFSVVVLGGAHDLADNIFRLADGKGECIRIEVMQWQEVAGHVQAK